MAQLKQCEYTLPHGEHAWKLQMLGGGFQFYHCNGVTEADLFKASPGRVWEMPPSALERIADVLEYFQKVLPICDHGNIWAACPSCQTKPKVINLS